MQPLSALLADLVRLPSVNPMGRTDIPPGICHEARVTARLEAWLRDLNVSVVRQPVAPGRDNLIARYDPPSPAPFTLLFEAHQDTVPVDGMTIDPFAATVREGNLYGRGACDVKAGAVAMFGAFRRLAAERPRGSAAVVLAYTVDEEHTFLGVQRLVTDVTADFAVVAEPTGLDVVRAHKGLARWTLDTAGTACHSSTPGRGVNAVYRMAKVLAAVEGYAARLHASPPDPLLGPPTLSVGMVTGGVSPNTVPDSARIYLDRRLLPGETAAAAIADLTQFLQARPEIDFPFTTQMTLACPALAPSGGDEMVARLGGAIDAVVGSHRVIGVPFGTDASTIQEAGIPAVVFGPGDIAQAHTTDEWVELSQVDQAAEVLWRFARG